MAEVKKKGRTMNPELLEKLAKAREKGLEVIRAKREAKQKAKEELMKKTYEIMEREKKVKKKPIQEESSTEEEESDYSIKARYEEKKPPTKIKQTQEPKPSIAKYNNVKKVKKTKIVYMTDSGSESSEEEVVYVPKKKASKKVAKQGENQIVNDENKYMEISQNIPLSTSSRYLDLF